jgi:hypothetical protein
MSTTTLTSQSLRPVKAWHEAGVIRVVLEDGRELSFMVAGNRRLESATSEQLSQIRLMRAGLHWPEVDEHLSIEGLLRGDHGQHVK